MNTRKKYKNRHSHRWGRFKYETATVQDYKEIKVLKFGNYRYYVAADSAGGSIRLKLNKTLSKIEALARGLLYSKHKTTASKKQS